MKENLVSLESYLPKKDLGAKIELRNDLLPVVSRIANLIPGDLIWEIYSSTPNETGRKIVFPYSRIDMRAIIVKDILYLFKNFKDHYVGEEFQKWYDRMCKSALEEVLWVDIGFQGLQNLAKSDASKNWTLGVGHIVTPKVREERIMTNGKLLYEGSLEEFTKYRREQGIKDDYFGKYHLENLLKRFEK